MSHAYTYRTAIAADALSAHLKWPHRAGYWVCLRNNVAVSPSLRW